MDTSLTFFVDLITAGSTKYKRHVLFEHSFWLISAQSVDDAYRTLKSALFTSKGDGYWRIFEISLLKQMKEDCLFLTSRTSFMPKKTTEKDIRAFLTSKKAVRHCFEFEAELQCALDDIRGKLYAHHFIVVTVTMKKEVHTHRQELISTFWRIFFRECVKCV